MKKLFAILMAILMIASFTACNGNEKPDVEGEVVTDTNGEAVTDSEGETLTETQLFEEESTLADETSTTEASTLVDVSMPASDPATWSAEEIVEFYKNAAIKSKTKVTSKQTMTLNEISVNNGDGFIGKVVEWVTPFLEDALKDSSTEFEGITGGYENLSVTDTKSARAYKSGDYVVVEMTMKEQTDGVHADSYSGTVGHAISVVGDLSVVADALPMFNIDFDNADIKLHYANPKLRVKINKDGIIEKGTWTYIVNVSLANLRASADAFPAIEVFIDKASGSVGYIIVTGGGF